MLHAQTWPLQVLNSSSLLCPLPRGNFQVWSHQFSQHSGDWVEKNKMGFRKCFATGLRKEVIYFHSHSHLKLDMLLSPFWCDYIISRNKRAFLMIKVFRSIGFWLILKDDGAFYVVEQNIWLSHSCCLCVISTHQSWPLSQYSHHQAIYFLKYHVGNLSAILSNVWKGLNFPAAVLNISIIKAMK